MDRPKQKIRSHSTAVKVDTRFLRGNAADIEGTYQYFEMYKHRLQTMRSLLLDNILSQWGNITIEKRVLDAHNSDESRDIVITGTLYKEMSEKPSPLKEFSESKVTYATKHDKSLQSNVVDTQMVGTNDEKCHVNEKDYLMVEDEYGSIRIEGKCLNVPKMYTGIIIALKGHLEQQTGIFQVRDYLLLGLPAQTPLPNRFA
ncbi:hypothetical protein RFI_06510 [Reticulomyxa filosa]|uniref:DNA polymerase delta subunit OB-fold domain-containing protein n=1 Tax=Reticulomyxa filosa TaxID=46433 RepID=X6NX71_RETFI|nr:hypothetical protein RFI_06510 [Reticulomyxa filosa]|eukprot:ETO30611.1 hypothetical protein RFI_06510 [Reticulomyxa filosa]